MHGDSCTAQRFQHGPKTSTCSGMMAEPPDLPCRDDVLVKNGAASPKSCLLSLMMRSPTAVGGLVLTGEASTATKTIFNKSPLRLYVTKEANLKKKNYGLQFHPPGTTAASGNCLLSPPAGELLKQNPDKI